ncbi:MAG: 4-(cytidine 5'-diphospho)-2-C-methyl-D-erythritol kinase [Burkholderiales bacterium]|nr:4-(cytidine 5'-diphospho)-2-C-methyl-D-erythritol kinase [Burkholderiales bacterium]
MGVALSPPGPAWPAPAKLNLFLHVVGRRADGYHLLQTVFRLIDRSDMLYFDVRRDGDIRLHTQLAGVPQERDLTWRAATALRRHTGCQLGADIWLDKRLPMGGGLGGGSSDAATVLLALNRLWGLGLTRAELQALGLTLGADVPFFLFGRNAFAEGVGERLQPIDLPPAWYLVLTPPVQVCTAEVFAAPSLTRNSPEIKMSDFPAGYGRNDLEPVVVERHPVVGEYLRWLRRHAEGRLTGSGGCVFAPFADRAAAEAVWSCRPAGWDGFIAEGLDRHPLFEAV